MGDGIVERGLVRRTEIRLSDPRRFRRSGATRPRRLAVGASGAGLRAATVARPRGSVSPFRAARRHGSARPWLGPAFRPAGDPTRFNRSDPSTGPPMLLAANPGSASARRSGPGTWPSDRAAAARTRIACVDRAWVHGRLTPLVAAAANGRLTPDLAAGSSARRAELRAAASDQSARAGRRQRPPVRHALPVGPPGLRWMSRTLRYHARGPVAQRQSRRLLISRSWVQVPPGSPVPGMPDRGPSSPARGARPLGDRARGGPTSTGQRAPMPATRRPGSIRRPCRRS